MKRTALLFLTAVLILIFSVPLSVLAVETTTAVETASNVQTVSSPMDKAFSTFTIVIMSVGILGLPAYFWLNSRRKRLLVEYEEDNIPFSDDENLNEENPDNENIEDNSEDENI